MVDLAAALSKILEELQRSQLRLGPGVPQLRRGGPKTEGRGSAVGPQGSVHTVATLKVV